MLSCQKPFSFNENFLTILLGDIERLIGEAKMMFPVLQEPFCFRAKYYNSIFRNCFALRNLNMFPNMIPSEKIQEIPHHPFFDLSSEPQETIPFNPIEIAPVESVASRLQRLRERQQSILVLIISH